MDVKIIDAGVDLFGWISKRIGWLFRTLQTGFVSHYAYWVSIGVMLLTGWYLIRII